MASRVLVLVLALWAWPGTSEATEYAVHWLQDGDAVHGRKHREPMGGDEDGCPVPSHLCHLTSCLCTGAPMTARVVSVVAPETAAVRAEAPIAEQRDGLGDPVPSLRPPIS